MSKDGLIPSRIGCPLRDLKLYNHFIQIGRMSYNLPTLIQRLSIFVLNICTCVKESCVCLHHLHYLTSSWRSCRDVCSGLQLKLMVSNCTQEQTKSKVYELLIRDILFADVDAALAALSEEQLLQLMDNFSKAKSSVKLSAWRKLRWQSKALSRQLPSRSTTMNSRLFRNSHSSTPPFQTPSP